MSKTNGAARHVEWICAGVILIVAAWFYLWTATSAGSPLTSKLQKDDLYNRLADGFLAGQLSFIEKPNPAIANLADPWDPGQNGPLTPFHDVSYYKGRYYLYFGPAPALLLLAPWKALTGTYLGENVATAIFAWFGALSSIVLVIALRRRHFPALPGWVGGATLVALAFGNLIPLLLRRPVFYELAIASAYAFAMASLLFLALALQTGPRRRLWLALAGTMYGLALASRPNYLFGSVILAAPFLPLIRRVREHAEIDWADARRDATAALLPLAAIGGLLLLYNKLRFESWAEFGQNYQFSGLNPQRDMVKTILFVPVNLWYYLFPPAQLSAFFPFVQVIHMPWFKVPAGYTGEEDVFGILPNMPFLWMTLFLIGAWRASRLPNAWAMRSFATAVLTLLAANALVVCRIGGASNRYMVDLFPPLATLACLGVFWAETTSTTRFRRAGVRMLWLGGLAVTVLFNVFASLQHNELLRYHNPAEYGRLAHAFDHVSTWLGEVKPSKVGPLRIRLKFPRGRTGSLEPLVVTGLSFRADFIWVYYADESHVQIGFEHTSYGGPVTKPPIAVDFAAEHVLEIEMGSLYPPVEHPFYDRIAPTEVSRLKRTLRVALDGKELLSGVFDFYDSSPGDVSVGRNPVSDAFGRRFTGRILGVERLPVGTVN